MYLFSVLSQKSFTYFTYPSKICHHWIIVPVLHWISLMSNCYISASVLTALLLLSLCVQIFLLSFPLTSSPFLTVQYLFSCPYWVISNQIKIEYFIFPCHFNLSEYTLVNIIVVLLLNWSWWLYLALQLFLYGTAASWVVLH